MRAMCTAGGQTAAELAEKFYGSVVGTDLIPTF
jgi:hypothetical protein